MRALSRRGGGSRRLPTRVRGATLPPRTPDSDKSSCSSSDENPAAILGVRALGRRRPRIISTAGHDARRQHELLVARFSARNVRLSSLSR